MKFYILLVWICNLHKLAYNPGDRFELRHLGLLLFWMQCLYQSIVPFLSPVLMHCGKPPPHLMMAIINLRYFGSIWKGVRTVIGQWMTHQEYCRFLVDADEKHKSLHAGESLWGDTEGRKLLEAMLYLNLDAFIYLIAPLHSHTGRPSAPPDIVLRSLFLFVLTRGGRFFTSAGIDRWLRVTVKENPALYTLLGCCSPIECPSIGASYSLLDLLWQGDRAQYFRDAQFSSRKNCRNGKLQIGSDNKAVDNEFTVEDMARRYRAGERLSGNYEMILQQMLAVLAVIPSLENGCIPRICCGQTDSTAYYEPASQFGKTKCGKARMDCQFRRECGSSAAYSCPDGSIGYDSALGRSFFGEHLHLLSVHNPDLHLEVPICFSLIDAPRHDSVVFFLLMQETMRNVPGFHMDFFTGDCAYDHPEIFRLLLENGTIPIIALSSKNTTYDGLSQGIRINQQGKPICKEGNEMRFLRNDEESQRWLYECPMLSEESCQCKNQSGCPYSSIRKKLLAINPKDSPRFFTVIPRGTTEFGTIFNERSSSERINKTLLKDYGLEEIMMRNADHRSFLVAAACVFIHIRAWIKMGLYPTYLSSEEHATLLGKTAPEDYASHQLHADIGLDYIQRLIARNEQERMVNALRFKEAANFRAQMEPLMKATEDNWHCPKESMRESSREEPVDLPLPESAPTWKPFVLYGHEAHSMKKWEIPYVGYARPEIVVDPFEIVYPTKVGTGVLEDFELISLGYNKNNPRSYNGFVELLPNMWVRKAPPLYTIGESSEARQAWFLPELGVENLPGSYTPPLLPNILKESRDAWNGNVPGEQKPNAGWCVLPNRRTSCVKNQKGGESQVA